MENAKAEVYRYMGRSGQPVPPELDRLVCECMELMREESTFRHVRGTFGISFNENEIAVNGTGLSLRGDGIMRRLCGCDSAVVFAATLGVGADNSIRRFERADITRSFILDACATQLIEQKCDEIEGEVREEAKAENILAVSRYSPGYDGLPLDIQPRILAILNAERTIGLTCTESLILLPRKSVTAIIGLGKNAKEAHGASDKCADCPIYGDCRFRKDC